MLARQVFAVIELEKGFSVEGENMASITRRSLLTSIGFVAVGATLSACGKKVEYGTDSTSGTASSDTE